VVIIGVAPDTYPVLRSEIGRQGHHEPVDIRRFYVDVDIAIPGDEIAVSGRSKRRPVGKHVGDVVEAAHSIEVKEQFE
jgi:hypothetical protein